MKQVELKPHNQTTYNTLNEMLESTQRVACVQPTGTGKSYLALRFIQDHMDKKILLLAPTDIILDQFQETAKQFDSENPEKSMLRNTTFVKYLDLGLDGFSSIYEEEWDYIILDEFHRIGAKTWNTYFQNLIGKNPNAKLIGLSATPIRYLDDGRNMGKEIFNEQYACHYNVNEAWKQNILPTPKYVLTDYRITEGTKDYIKKRYPYAKSEEQIKHIVKTFLENGGNMHQILKENLPNRQGKYIVFCSDAAHIQKMRPVVKNWLSPLNSYIHIYTSLAKEDTQDKELLAFKNDDSDAIKLLFCVERLNEGLHLSNIDGEFMLRPTMSPIIYMQQMGRTLNAGASKQPVIFDLVNNFSEYRRTILKFTEMREEDIESLNPTVRKEYESYREGRYDQFLEFDFVQKAGKICDLFDEVEISSLEYNWNKMFKLLQEFYKETNRFPKSYESYCNENVGQWLYIQKYRYERGKLLKERKERLESIGVILKTISRDERWNQMFDLLKQYHKETDKFPTQNTVYKNIKIGNWYKKQLELYNSNRLPLDRVNMLNSIGVPLGNQYDINWNKNFELLKEYFSVYHEFPVTETIYKNKNIGAWLTTQRAVYRQNKLTPEKIRKLKEIGYTIDKNLNEVFEEKWNEMFEVLQEFYNETNRWPKDKEIYYGKSIGIWFFEQKQRYRKGILLEDRREKLESIGACLKSMNNDQRWNRSFEVFKQYFFETGELPRATCIYQGMKIGSWFYEQKRNAKSGKLSKEHREKLENIGIVFEESRVVSKDDYER